MLLDKMNQPRILAIIPARGGSKGLPGKNIRSLCGKPLIDYSINAALKSKYVAKTLVTSDSEQILDRAAYLGATPLQRPSELAQDSSSIESVLVHAIKSLKEQYDVLVLLQPTSPLRNHLDVDAAILKFLSSGRGSVYSVTLADHHPYKMFLQGPVSELIPLTNAMDLSRPRQALPIVYRQNGAIYVVSIQDFLQNNSLYSEPLLGYEMSSVCSVDIDNEIDFRLAEIIMSEHKEK